MKKKTTLAGLGLLAVTVGGLGVGTAYANTSAPATAKISRSALTAQAPGATDNDNVQQGNQTGPDTAAADTPTAGDTPDGTTPATTDVPTAGDTPDGANPATTNVPAGGDKADSGTSTDKPDTEAAGSETPDSSDGPGGHADTNSNADTQQEGQH